MQQSISTLPTPNEPDVDEPPGFDDWEISVLRRFREAPDEALFGNREKSIILDVSESWLEKGNGPRTRRYGRLRKSTKGDIREYALKGTED